MALLLLGPLRIAAAHEFESDHELGFRVGGQAGSRNAPAGFKLFTNYGYRMTHFTWLNLDFNASFGNRECTTRFVNCSALSATSLEFVVGVKLQFETDHPDVVPYAKIGAGGVYIVSPGRDDDGVGAIVRPGGGVKFYATPSVAVGLELVLGVGPLVLGCGPGCNDTVAFVAVDFAAGIDWNF